MPRPYIYDLLYGLRSIIDPGLRGEAAKMKWAKMEYNKE